MRRLLSIAALAAALLTLPANAAAWTAGSTLLGVYYGNQGWNITQVQAMESWQAKRHATLVMFTDWTNSTKVMNNLFGQQLPAIWNNGNVPLITWEPTTGGSTPADIETRIANGQYDAYITTWATRLRTFLAGPDGNYVSGDTGADDRRVYLRLAHEMNGNWYPWSGNAGDYVKAWRRVHAIFDNLGIDKAHVQWVWAANNTDSVGGPTAEDYYPGDEWVDWLGVDGYNWGASQSWSTWQTADQVFGDMAGRLRKISGKPLAITETASTSATAGGPNIAAKTAWIQDLFTWVADPTNNIRMLCPFNDDKETDWAVFGGASGDSSYKYGRSTYKAYSGYKAAVAASNVIATTGTGKLLSTELFQGK